MVVIVTNGTRLPKGDRLVERLRIMSRPGKRCPER